MVFNRFKFICVLFFWVSTLLANSPRLLIGLGPECDFVPLELAQSIEARIVGGSEEEIFLQVSEEDLIEPNHLIVLASPIQNLSKLASKLFYDSIFLNDTWEKAIAELKVKISSIPISEADFDKINPQELDQFYRLFAKVKKILNQKKINFWAISGTLLGAIRHQGMIPWDDDIDIIFKIQDKQRLEKLNALFKMNGLRLFIYNNYYYKIFPINGKEIYLSDGSSYPWKYPFIDLFPVNKIDKKIRIVSRTYPSIDMYQAIEDYKGWWLYPEEIQLPSLVCPFGPLQIPIPHNAHEILDREYGCDWPQVAYMSYNHATETDRKRVKVTLTKNFY